MIKGELTWPQFKTLDSIRNLTESKQVQHYYEYLTWLGNQYNHQNKGKRFACTNGMDVVFVIDNTNSMDQVIDNIKGAVASIVATIATQSVNNYRLGLVVFDEYTLNSPDSAPLYLNKPAYTSLPSAQKYVNTYDVPASIYDKVQYITALQMLSTNNSTSFISQLSLLNTTAFDLGNGANFAEPSDIAIDRVVNYNLAGTFRDNVTKLIVLITDAPSSGYDDTNNAADFTFANQLIADCISKGVKIILMETSYTNQEPLPTLALGTGGLVSATNFDPQAIISSIQTICTLL